MSIPSIHFLHVCSDADFSKALDLDPRLAAAYIGRGVIKRDRGDQDGAIADFNRAIEINPRLAANLVLSLRLAWLLLFSFIDAL
ncbi:MAG TPA: tetratricopeptide repeat protein [Blastocatellia bacterium]|nr:tetratricopeptide repeat protein [Blastocatellia bacterium]